MTLVVCIALLAVSLLAVAGSALPQQLTFSSPAETKLSVQETSDWTILSHAAFKDHRVRIRSPKGVCDE